MSKTNITNKFKVPDYYANKAKRILNFVERIDKIVITAEKKILVTYVFNGKLQRSLIAGTGHQF